MRYAILDDDPLYFEEFMRIVTPYIDRNQTTYFHSPNELLKSMVQKRTLYDAIFLDIDMPEVNGITFAKMLYQNNISDSIIVFITNQNNLVYQAIGLNVFSFVYKPDLAKEAKRLFSNLDSLMASRSSIVLLLKSNSILVQRREIMVIERINRKIIVSTKNKTNYTTLFSSLEEIYKILHHPDFQYANRSTIVNIKYIKTIKKNDLYLKDDRKIEISKQRLKSINSSFMQYNNHV